MASFIPLQGKLGTKRIFTGGPIELPLQFLKDHDYVIELPDDSVLRFKSLNCAARSSVHYQLPVTDQSTQEIHSTEECARIVSNLGPSDRYLSSSSRQTAAQSMPVLRSQADLPRR
jgi:hypothetical protein